MCRWIAYVGKPLSLDTLVTRPSRSLIEQSLDARMSFRPDGSAITTNGDGFGMGWYTDKPDPGLFKVPVPAWHNENIVELCAHITSPLFMAHIRAASTGAIQRTNAHPFKHKNWLFQHNGYIAGFERIRRDLQFAIAPELYPFLEGTTDSETFFLLALSFGLEQHPQLAIERTIDLLAHVCREHYIPLQVNLSCALSDGKTLYTLRYSKGVRVHSQYYSTHTECMRSLDEAADTMPRNSVVVVSEPLDQSGDLWEEMPVNSFATIRDGQVHTNALNVQ